MQQPAKSWHIRSADDVEALWVRLMGPGGFGTRSLWLVFLDDEGWTLPTIMPLDDIPARLDEGVRGLAETVSELCDDGGVAAGVLLLLSRPGGWVMTDSDRAWARTLDSTLDRRYHRWPIHLATADSIRPFTVDDLLEAS